MDTRRAVCLNLDADAELAMGAGYTPTKRVLEAMRPHVQTLASSFLRKGDVLVDENSEAGIARDLPGIAFCPTPRAISLLTRAGAVPVDHPSFEILRRVNSRAFCASLGQTMPEAQFVTDAAVAVDLLSSSPALSTTWRVKPAFGMAGRGQRLITAGSPNAAEKTFVEACIERDGGVQIEPNVRIEIELGLHGVLTQDGELTMGRVVRQHSDVHGAWISTEPLPQSDHETALREELTKIATALHAAGYFGPFGIDAFVYEGNRLQPRSEINARYSMGFPQSQLPIFSS